jgi:transposase InsO family protein
MIGKELQAHRIKMGRDKLYELLSNHGLLLRRRRKRIRTTNSDHPFRKYPNLIIGAIIDHPKQVWVSDITYWKVNDSFLYLSLITDVYSKKIVGYKLSKTLEARSSLAALKMAIKISNKSNLAGLIHHSDRGIQYCTHEYTQMLTAYQIQISMTQSGDPLENPIAERLNGIIKNEYLSHYHPIDFTEAEVLVASVVDRYNMQRPHLSCNLEVPETIHNSNRSLLGKHNLSTYPRNKQYV